MNPNGLDHDDGMEAFTVEKHSVIRKRGVYVGGAPAYIMAQVHKDKDAFNVIVSHSTRPCLHAMRLAVTDRQSLYVEELTVLLSSL